MEAKNLFELFYGKVFRIPDYQRGYAWSDKQLTELWDDLYEIGENSKHYTGTIYLEDISPNENEEWLTGVKFYNIVDGQQRLTTISILIFELLKLTELGYNEKKKADLYTQFISESKLNGNSTIYKFRYDKKDKNCNYLLHNIFENDTIILEDERLNLYSKNLSAAKLFFAERLSKMSNEEREILFKKITTALQFDIRTIEKDLDVQAVFETMNNRGKPLTTLEKLKNRLIYLTSKLDCAPEDIKNLREKINQAWGKIYFCLAQNPDCILDEDVFLSAHLSLYRKPKEAVFSEKNAEEKVFQMFCNKPEKYEKDDSIENEPTISYEKIESYIIKLSEAAIVWYKIHHSNLLIVKKILLLNGAKEMKVFLLALFLNTEESELEKILLVLENVLFRNRIPSLWVIDERTFASWARDVYRNEENLSDIHTKLTHLIDLPITTQNMINSMNELFYYIKGAKGFHRWGIIKYFLFEYEENLKSRFKEVKDKVSIDDFDSTTIEHIIPQQFWDHWADTINNFSINIDKDNLDITHKVLLNTLGNLTILMHGKNSSLGNKSWLDKKGRFISGSYNEISISQNEEWGIKEVVLRGYDMIDFLKSKVKGLNISDNERDELLFVEDFIIEKIK